MKIEDRLYAAFRQRNVQHCTIGVGPFGATEANLIVSVASDCPPITNACKADSRCCYQNGHDGKCDITLHRHFDKILTHVAQIMAI